LSTSTSKVHEEENGDKARKEMNVSLSCSVSKYGFEKSHGNQMKPILQGANPYLANMKDLDEVRAWC
jgi:hypothetical protein